MLPLGDALRRITSLKGPRALYAHLHNSLAANVKALFKFVVSNQFENELNIW